jgi:hypothetical protein
MRARTSLVLAVLLPALALGAAACGRSAKETQPSPTELKTIETQWRIGLVEWRHTMLKALDGLSIVFATNGSVSDLSNKASRASARLSLFEGRLDTCTAQVHQLGPAPEPYAQARVYALEACKRLKEGVGKVDEVVADLRHGFAVDPIDPIGNASMLLAAGQTELSTAVQALEEPSA